MTGTEADARFLRRILMVLVAAAVRAAGLLAGILTVKAAPNGFRQRPELKAERWAAAHAPSLAEMEALAAASFARLPKGFRNLAQDVLIRVEDFPSDDVMQEMDAGEFDLLGLFHGTGLAHAAAVAETLRMPNTVYLYRRAILDYWAEHHESLGAIVTHVLVHEIGHHFGLSDEDMEAVTGRSP